MDSDDPLADSAVLIIDVINDFAFPEAQQLLSQMPPVVEAIDALRRRAESLGRPVVHVNDNFGRWRSNFDEVIEHCKRKGAPGADIAEVSGSLPVARETDQRHHATPARRRRG